MNAQTNTHSKVVGYLLWIFGFPAGQRFYYGKPLTGIIWVLTLGVFLVGGIVDAFLIPSMDREADRRFVYGLVDYTAAWLLLVLLGWLGIHRFYMGKWGTGLLYLFTLGLFGIGLIYDCCTLNCQVSEINHARRMG